MATKRCPKCGDEFIESVRRCPDCGVLLAESTVDESAGELAEITGLEPERRGDQLVYPLNEWSAEERTLADQLLAGADIPRAWEGTNLVIGEKARSHADPLLVQAAGWSTAGLDQDEPKLVYELGEWGDTEVGLLADGLDKLGIPHEFTYEGDLVVLEEDEERVEGLFDSIEFPDALEPDLDADATSGLDLQATLSDLFDAVDRLRKHARNAEGVLGLISSAKALDGVDVPFGFAPAVWNDIVVQATTLRAAIEGDVIEGDADDDLEHEVALDEQIEERAEELRTLLRNYV